MKLRWINPTIIGLSILFIINGIGSPAAPKDNVQVSFINVGHSGEATLIRDPNGFDILIDGGESRTASTLVAYLREQGVDDIDVMIASHADSNVVGGLIDVLEMSDIPVESVLYNGYPGSTATWRNFEMAVADVGVTLTPAQYPQTYTWGEITARILNPLPGLTNPDQNEASVAVLLEHGDTNILFTGDIHASTERRILENVSSLELDILKVSHRGSQHASSSEFLSAVQPAEAVMFSGTNPYGLPNQETISRLVASGARVWRTDETGTIIVESDGVNYNITSKGLPTPSPTSVAVIATSPEPTLAPMPTPTTTPYLLIQWVQDNRDEVWFKPFTALGGFLAVAIIGAISLLLWASKMGSAIFDRHWLISLAAKPLLITPGLGRWALFLGYKQRLKTNPAVVKAAEDYFGLPAVDPHGEFIKPDPMGDELHTEIIEAFGPQQPVLLEGRGGAGKSTLLARWVYLALTNQLQGNLKGYRPILVTPAYYRGNLVQAIASVLRERDGIAADDAIVRSQLGSGKYLVLFDGVSEVEGDKDQAIREILRTAQNADYSRCRFLVTTRPLERVVGNVPAFELKPLTPIEIQKLLPRYGLGSEREYQVKRQLDSFEDKPIEPLLFSMILGQSETGEISQTRAQLYERYFQRLLHVEKHEDWWRGWRRCLEVLAQWFMLDTGKRGVGLPREPLLNCMRTEDNVEWPSSKSLVDMLQANYELPVERSLDLLQRLKAAGILVEERRWRFAHDTFEEYFAASRVVSAFALSEQWPSVDSWLSSDELIQDFLEVLAFVREMETEQILTEMAEANSPSAWQAILLGEEIEPKTEIRVGGAFLRGTSSLIEPELVQIPAGTFLMGSTPEQAQNAIKDGLYEEGATREQPQHSVELSAYRIAKYPVTNLEYQAFVGATGHRPPFHWDGDRYPEDKGDHPVVNVSWEDAETYCRWLEETAGMPYRLPTEAEWEKAARGEDGRIYPWGDEWDQSRCNTYESGIGETTSVRQFSPEGESPYGVVDMVGNVWEWCADWFDKEEYQRREGSQVVDPKGPDLGTHRLLRGGSWDYSLRSARCAGRNFNLPYYWYGGIGFRVVVSLS